MGEQPKWAVGMTVAVVYQIGLGVDHAIRKRTVKRVLKKTVTLNDETQWRLDGGVKGPFFYNAPHIEPWTEAHARLSHTAKLRRRVESYLEELSKITRSAQLETLETIAEAIEPLRIKGIYTIGIVSSTSGETKT